MPASPPARVDKGNPNYREINAKQTLADSNSIFYYYSTLIRLRKEKSIIVHGSYDLILDEDREIYAFTRTLGDERLVVVLNFTNNSRFSRFPIRFSLPTRNS
jgi:oligo-1,6-glucosidase